MSLLIQAHADALLALLAAAPGTPALVVCDGHVPDGTTAPYALVYFYIQTPDGLAAPDAVKFNYAATSSDPIDSVAYVNCVGADPQGARAARAVSGRVRAALQKKVPVIAGRSCGPIMWRDGQPPQRNEETLVATFDQVDVYGWRSYPG